jgi:hypothetical protein
LHRDLDDGATEAVVIHINAAWCVEPTIDLRDQAVEVTALVLAGVWLLMPHFHIQDRVAKVVAVHLAKSQHMMLPVCLWEQVA